MKKIYSIIVAFSFVLGMLVLPQFDAYFTVTPIAKAGTDDAFVALQFGGGDGQFMSIFGNFFQVDSNIGQDMYEHIYDRVRSEGANLAVNRTAERTKVSKNELYALIPGSNISEVLTQPDPRAPLKPEQIIARREQIIEDLSVEKRIADLEVEARMQVQSTELFTNGDESDSGFDLISDLEVIEYLLFNKEMSGGGGNSDSRDGGGDGGSTAAATKHDEAVAKKYDDQSPDSGSRGTQPQDPATAADANTRANQVECVQDDTLNRAIEDARKDEQKDTPPAPALGGLDADAGASASGTPAASDDTDKPKEEIKPEPEALWKRKLKSEQWCSKDQVLCIHVEPQYKTESSYTASNNCVACHIQKINAAFRKTLSHNLVPNKVTGNLLEGPKCKDAITGMNWATSNIILIGQPILTPPNDDLIVKGDIFKNLADFIKQYILKPMLCTRGTVCEISTAQQILTQQQPNATFDQATSAISNEETQLAAQRARQQRERMIQHRASAQGEQYQVILQELDTMNLYFANFMETYSSIGGDPEKSPCGILRNLKTCS